ncbi:MAG: hypothetical protein JHC22_08530 [Thermoproteus sp.]|jgi:hypothetical protein|nr:hypothetical protein [Thermoproteus sp.]
MIKSDSPPILSSGIAKGPPQPKEQVWQELIKSEPPPPILSAPVKGPPPPEPSTFISRRPKELPLPEPIPSEVYTAEATERGFRPPEEIYSGEAIRSGGLPAERNQPVERFSPPVAIGWWLTEEMLPVKMRERLIKRRTPS